MADEEKGLKSYSYMSRYSSVPVMGDSANGKQYHGTVKWINPELSYNIYKCGVHDTLEKIALNLYGNPQYWWIIADFNRIIDPFAELEEGRELKIISMSDVEFVQRW